MRNKSEIKTMKTITIKIQDVKFQIFFTGVPSHLHGFFSDYPLLPENRTIHLSELSDFTRDQMTKFNLKLTTDKKLVACLNKKFNYKIHVETLKLALQLGYEVYKVHKIIEFYQEDYLREYVGRLTKR